MEMNQNSGDWQKDHKENERVAGKDALPSRAEYHGKKRKPGNKKKMKVSIPLVLLLILLMLPIGILSIINSGDRSNANPVSGGSGEEVSFETEDPVNEPEPETKDKKEKEAEKSADESDKEDKKGEAKKEDPVKSEEKTAETEEPPAEKQDEQNEDNPGEKVTYHTVQQGENLFRIAMKYYNSQEGVEKIRQANGLAGNEISVGQTLKIPLP
ncbi:LysM peptidoglycan-binding domain-containing protein [Siminovitchia fortis]|uniref:LysM peptidoglycan-binding domain-containing protein n=1 Tax=Siminovitchia fortis TaxID=254758 RepID=UPI0016428E72|nr:LysM peptidoglycan-binding domain-containing protein [Siminovitchia fortis]